MRFRKTHRQSKPTKTVQIIVDDMDVELQLKSIKNVHLKVRAPDGRITVSAPHGLDTRTISGWIRDKRDWIQRKQRQVRAASDRRGAAYPFEQGLVEGRAIEWLGRDLTLRAVPPTQAGSRDIELSIQKDELWFANPAAQEPERQRDALRRFYRQTLQQLIEQRLSFWTDIAGVEPAFVGIRRMRSRWGSCNIGARRIWLNLELARMPPRCIEHVLVHELVHLHERGHNARFYGLMDRFMPDWREYSAELERRGMAGL